jgi:Zn finger protein HypA/HybF involved in hydrogenase expression
MLLMVVIETEGEVTQEVVRANVAQAIDMFRRGTGLSADSDEGMVTSVTVYLAPQCPECGGPLSDDDDTLLCPNCHLGYNKDDIEGSVEPSD